MIKVLTISLIAVQHVWQYGVLDCGHDAYRAFNIQCIFKKIPTQQLVFLQPSKIKKTHG